MKSVWVTGLGLAWVLAMAVPCAYAAVGEDGPTNAAFPWFGSLKKTEVNVRSGPGNQYPILWIYQRANYPVEVLARYDNYYKVRDVEGEEGWTYIGMVSRRTTGLVGGQSPANLVRHAAADSQILARLAPGVVVVLDGCEDVAGMGSMCKVEAPGARGWVSKKNLEMVP